MQTNVSEITHQQFFYRNRVDMNRSDYFEEQKEVMHFPSRILTMNDFLVYTLSDWKLKPDLFPSIVHEVK